MSQVTITIPDDRLSSLQIVAAQLGVTLEDLVLMSIEKLLAENTSDFQTAADYVLQKNAELYKRLA